MSITFKVKDNIAHAESHKERQKRLLEERRVKLSREIQTDKTYKLLCQIIPFDLDSFHLQLEEEVPHDKS